MMHTSSQTMSWQTEPNWWPKLAGLLQQHYGATCDGASAVLEHVGANLRVSRGEAFGRPWLVLVADVIPETYLGAHRALEHNMTLAIGALCWQDGRILLRHAMPVDDAGITSLPHIIDQLCGEAARIHASFTVYDHDDSFYTYLFDA